MAANAALPTPTSRVYSTTSLLTSSPSPASGASRALSFQEQQRLWFAHPSDYAGEVTKLGILAPPAPLPVGTLDSKNYSQKSIAAPRPSLSSSRTLSFQEQQRLWFAHPSDKNAGAPMKRGIPAPPAPLPAGPLDSKIPSTSVAPPSPGHSSSRALSFQERQRLWFAHPSEVNSAMPIDHRKGPCLTEPKCATPSGDDAVSGDSHVNSTDTSHSTDTALLMTFEERQRKLNDHLRLQ